MNCAIGDKNGRVSVIIPSYNRAHLLPDAIGSVLSQTVADLCDIIVVDDGSTDDTAEVVANLGRCIDYIRQSNSGAGAARNRGIRAARNEFVAFLDSDDQWMADKIERQLEVMRRWPEVVLVAGRGTERYADGREVPHRVPEIATDCPTDFAPALFDRNIMSTPSVMVRRSSFDESGFFREDLPRSQDYHMWVRLACRGPCVFVDAPLATYAADTPHSLQRDTEAALRSNVRARYLLQRELRRRPDCRGIWRCGLARNLATLRDRCFSTGRFGEAARFGLASLRYRPLGRPRWEWARPLSALWYAAAGGNGRRTDV